jgi:translation initiation factor 2 subunit 3
MSKIIKLSDIIDNQPILNIGCIGHVAHGKTTLIYDLTGIKTIKHSLEIERNITINLGYANLRIYYDKVNNKYINSNIKLEDPNFILKKHFSFIDCPGHQSFMATMLSGTESIDIAFILISAGENIPQPQTVVHTEILNYTNIDNILILLNKIDLITDEKMTDAKLIELNNFIDKHDKLKSKQIIPISAQKKINLDKVLNYLVKIPNNNISNLINQPFKMNILRSFNINKISVNVEELVGGVIGGSIKSGYVSVDDWIVIKPGLIVMRKEKWFARPIFCQVKTIKSDNVFLNDAYPGGLIALGLNFDPALCRNNNLLGNKIYKLTKNNFEDIKLGNDLTYEFNIKLEYLKDAILYQKITDIILLINSSTIKGRIISSNKDRTELRIITEKPIIYDNSSISVLNKTPTSIELFAKGTIIESYNKVNIKLPTNINNIFNILKDKEDEIIIEDIDIINDDILENIDIKKEIIKNLNPVVIFKMNLPMPEFKIDTTRYIWKNAKNFISRFNLDTNKDLKVEIDQTNIKWLCFGKMITEYFNYEYASDDGIADISNERIIIHIKRSTKNKPQNVISKFIKNYYTCSKCNSISSRIGKIISQTLSICVICNNRNKINDEWIK